jgi:hypothetical protein
MTQDKIYHELGLQVFTDPRADEIMNELRDKLAPIFGITVIGPYMTLRYYGKKKQFIQVSFQVTDMTDETQFDYEEDK